MDSRAAALRGGESGPAIIPHKAAESPFVEAINHASFEMPPAGKLPVEQIAILTRWVQEGAAWPGDAGEADVAKAPKITEEDRAYWAFQPLAKPQPPETDDSGWARNPIDKFIYRRLKAEGLTPSPMAERRVLIRRAYFDLWGLPPSPEEVEAFVADLSPDAYERLIDRLLESPRYGERWGRHWLDLVRYAESDGFRQDAYRPEAWRYRDYVIRSFNEDKPYPRFVQEQLAGDEIDPENPEALLATGYLRHWTYEYNQRDVRTQWRDIMNDITDVTSDVFLGLGMGCARCHDHKFDPILQKDYFALQAFLANILPLDEPFAPADAARQTAEAKWDQATREIRQRMEALLKPARMSVERGAINKFPEDIQVILRKDPAERTPYETQLATLALRQVVSEYDKLEAKLKPDARQEYDKLKAELATHDALRPPPAPIAMIVRDVSATPAPTIIPGDRKKEIIEPGFLTVLGSPAVLPAAISSGVVSSGRRAALAQWLTQPDNPLTTRVIVNRIWQYHFGRGLVATSSDFGRLGEKPSHPELLDWLTGQFVENGWSFKQMHRLLMTSATYRQSSTRVSEVARRKDPENRLLWRMNLRRLEAEQIRDAMLVASGELDLKMGGPAIDAKTPRRSVYVKVVRNTRDPLLDVFDLPEGFSSCSVRNCTTTATQSLLLLNGDWPLARAKAFAKQLKAALPVSASPSAATSDFAPQESSSQTASPDGKQTGAQSVSVDPSKTKPVAAKTVAAKNAEPLPTTQVNVMIDRAFLLAYARRPTEAERREALEFLYTQSNAVPPREESETPTVVAQMPAGGGRALVIREGAVQDRIRVAANDALPTADFTIEAIVVLKSLYPSASVRVLASQWTGDSKQPGWSFGVTSEKSAYKPRNLILQLVGQDQAGQLTYEVVPSDLRVPLNQPVYIAASVKLSDPSEAGVTFYMKDLTRLNAPLVSANAAHQVLKIQTAAAFVIGGRDVQPAHGWDGLIDEVRLSRAALGSGDLLLKKPEMTADTVGFWQFEDQAEPFADSSPQRNDAGPMGRKAEAPNQPPATAQAIPSGEGTNPIANSSPKPERPTAKPRPTPTFAGVRDEAWVDFCHVLLNSSELLYVE